MYLAAHGRQEDALRVFQKGIEINRSQGNLHASSEIEAAVRDLTAEE